MGSAMGCLHSLNEARERGAQVVSVDPRMPDIAYGDAKVGPDSSGHRRLLRARHDERHAQEGLADLKFLAKHTNAAYLIKADGRPLTEADMKAGGRKDRYAVHDLKTNRIVFQGVVLDEKGRRRGLRRIRRHGRQPALRPGGEACRRHDDRRAHRARHPRRNRRPPPPEASQKITGIPADELVRLAHNFANPQRASLTTAGIPPRTATTSSSISSSTSSTPFNGNVDREGGIVVTAGGGFKRPGVAAGKGPQRREVGHG